MNITWIDDNHAEVEDGDKRFNVTVRTKTNAYVAGNPVKPRLYIGGKMVREMEETLGHRKAIAWAKEFFGPTLKKIVGRDVQIKFSSKAGCSCGCSPGFIVQDANIPFDIWMDAC
jgi:hypothetical protein